MKYLMSIIFAFGLVVAGCEDQKEEGGTDTVQVDNSSGIVRNTTSWTCPRCDKTFNVKHGTAIPIKHDCVESFRGE